ncbi:MAG: hypothetical protein J0M35_14480 [Candidatus Obscuribacter phosphatis]|uniref:Uncharacterized protein n=1 Tax=Candidatus Obscuribacter phosphatis TaxID=1906157 RepID=A0A8J7PH57_9BACT|nr:hypothetical protein [Candidatus Obscuribacter phosphatis]
MPMKDDFKASMYFLLALGFSWCLYLAYPKVLPWEFFGVNISLLVVLCILLMVKNLGFNRSFLVQKKTLLLLVAINLVVIAVFSILDTAQLLSR